MPRLGVALCLLIALATSGAPARADRLWEKFTIDGHSFSDSGAQMVKPDDFPKQKIDEGSSAAKPPRLKPYPLQLPIPAATGAELVKPEKPELGVIEKSDLTREAGPPETADGRGAAADHARKIIVAPARPAIEIASYKPGAKLGDRKETPMPAAAFAVGVAYDGDRWCTGVLIDPRHVLTAGHCACGEPSTYRIVTDPEIARSRRSDEYRVKGRPILFDRRSCPRSDEAVPGGDLALLPLDRDVACADEKTCRLGVPATVDAIREVAPKGSSLKVVGYGWTDKEIARTRNSGHVPVVSSACMEDGHRAFCNPFTEMILADLQKPPEKRTDTCGGDSGGPVFLEVGEWAVLIAITSRATPWNDQGERGCGAGGVYELLGRKSVWAWLEANGVRIAGADAARAGAASFAHESESAQSSGVFNCADYLEPSARATADKYCYPARRP